MSQTIGTCGNCGGRVTTPDAWMSSIPPMPKCESCGATVSMPHGAVLPMNPSPNKMAGETIVDWAERVGATPKRHDHHREDLANDPDFRSPSCVY